MIKEKYLKNFHVTHDKFNKYFVSYNLVLSTVLKDRWSGHNYRDELAFLLGPNNYVALMRGVI